MKNILLILAILVLSKGYAQNINTPAIYTPVNQNRILTSAYPFENFTYDARSAAMGNAGVALSPDVNSVLMNPSKLVFLIYPQDTIFIKKGNKKDSLRKDSLSRKAVSEWGLSLNYTPYARNLSNDMNLYNVNIYKFYKQGVFALSLKYFDGGNVEMRNAKGELLGNSNTHEYALTGSYSKQISEHNSLGIGLKYIYSNLVANQTYNGTPISAANSIAADIYYFHSGQDIYQQKSNWFNYGAALTNIGSKVNYGDYIKRSFQPTNLKVGVAENLALGKEKQTVLTLTIDANKLLVPTPAVRDANNNVIQGTKEDNISGIGTIFQSWGTAPDGMKETLKEITFSFGAECVFKKLLSLRGGYFSENIVKGNQHYYTLGAGLQIKGLALDFAYLFPTQTGNPLANTWRLGLNYSGRKRK